MASPDKEELDEVGREIDEARSQARAHDTIPDPNKRQERFYESGDEQGERNDDQTIAPPG